MSEATYTLMVVKAAREMVRIHAEACNVNKDDLWAIEGQSFIDEAQSILDACAAPDLLEVLQAIVRVADGRRVSGNLILDENSPFMDAARDAIAAATGENRHE